MYFFLLHLLFELFLAIGINHFFKIKILKQEPNSPVESYFIKMFIPIRIQFFIIIKMQKCLSPSDNINNNDDKMPNIITWYSRKDIYTFIKQARIISVSSLYVSGRPKRVKFRNTEYQSIGILTEPKNTELKNTEPNLIIHENQGFSLFDNFFQFYCIFMRQFF